LRPLAKKWPAALCVLTSTACLDVVDVVQPSEVPAGSVFEIAAAVRADADFPGRDAGPAFGVFAVSLPTGAAVLEGRFDGAAAGKLERRGDVGPGVLEERPGYEWSVWVTREPGEASALAGRTYTVKLRIRAGPDAGDYRLAYAAGAAAATAAGRPDAGRLVWGNVGRDARIARGVTFK
jgi:hypothetical protein